MKHSLRSLGAIRHVKSIDGFIAIAFTLLYAALMMLALSIFPRTSVYIYLQIALQAGFVLLILLVLRLRKQPISSIGLHGDTQPFIALALFTVVSAVNATQQRNDSLLGKWFFYVIAVAGIEELLFRGFLHPRLVKVLGSHVWATLLAGSLFGAMHHIRAVVWDHAPWMDVFSELGGGVLAHLFFLVIYAKTGNILDAVLLHAVLDYSKYVPWMLMPCLLYITLRVAIVHVRRHKPTKMTRDTKSGDIE